MSGETVAIIGGGPSLATFDASKLRGARFIVANSGGRALAGSATGKDVLYFTDNSWAERFGDVIGAWPGVVLTSNRNSKLRLGDAVNHFDITALTATMAAPADHVQASSAHIAACFAAASGASKLLLVAMECRAFDGRTHGHNDYGPGDERVFEERFIPGWRGLVPVFDRLGVDVVNVTPESAVHCFRRGEIDEEVQ